jgi:hypothetical protein
MHRLLVLVLAVVAVSMSISSVDARRPIASDGSAYRKAPSRARQPQGSGVYEVAFSDAEESVLIAQQGDTPQMIAGRLTGRSENQVQRRCIEMGLRCAGDAAPPTRNSEKWRGMA